METMELFSFEELKELIRNEVQKAMQENFRKPFLNMEEVCKYLDISRNTLYMWNSKNKIPYYKPDGKKNFYKLEDIDAFILNPKNKIKSHKEIETEVRTKIMLKSLSLKK